MENKNQPDTEQKIKDAARIIFQQKGYAGTKTRDIAEAAGINLALLNYYFRSKQKLYDLIMTETMQGFFKGVIEILSDESTSIEEKIQLFVNHYIDLLSVNSNIPHFILNNIRENPDGYMEKLAGVSKIKSTYFFEQFMQATMDGKLPRINPVHYLLNLVSMVVFPFLVQPMIMVSSGLDQEAYQHIINERKKLIPLWLKEMVKVE